MEYLRLHWEKENLKTTLKNGKDGKKYFVLENGKMIQLKLNEDGKIEIVKEEIVENGSVKTKDNIDEKEDTLEQTNPSTGDSDGR